MKNRTVPALRYFLRGIAFTGIAAFCIWVAVYFFQHQSAPPAVKETLFPGIVFERVVETAPRPLVWHLIKIDLQTPGLRFSVSGPNLINRLIQARTTSAFLSETGAQIAINGDFFYPFHAKNMWDYYPHDGDPVTVQGRACSDGYWYATGPEREAVPALFLTRDNRAFIGFTPPKGFTPYNVISGNFLLLERGKVALPGGNDLQPRTVVGLDSGGRFLWLLVVDGRQEGYSEGATGEEAARFLQERGASTVLNLDGGGSATLVAQKENRPKVLNRPYHVSIPGRERPVANHLAIFVPKN